MRPAWLSKAARRSSGEECAAGDDLLGGGFAAPLEADLRGTGALEVFDLDVHLLAGDEIDRGGVFGNGAGGPAVDQGFVVDPEADAIIGLGIEGVAFGFGG